MKVRKPWGGDFSETNALAFGEQGTAEGRKFHIEKRKRASKGLEVVFDPEEHKDYLTGFHKRKVERRHKAQQEIAEKEKKQRLEDRAEKRAKLREDLDLKRYETPSDSEGVSEDEEGVPGRGVRVFKNDEAVTTVTVTSVFLNSDEEREAAAPKESDQEGEDAGAVKKLEKDPAISNTSKKSLRPLQKKLKKGGSKHGKTGGKKKRKEGKKGKGKA